MQVSSQNSNRLKAMISKPTHPTPKKTHIIHVRIVRLTMLRIVATVMKRPGFMRLGDK